MRTDKAGNKLYRKMTVKVIFPSNMFPDRVYMQHAGPRQGFGPEGIDQMLDQIADQLDTLYPFWNFKPVELLPIGSTIRFAFIFAGNNPNYAPPASDKPPTESSTPEPAPLEDHTTEAIKVAVGTTLQELAARV